MKRPDFTIQTLNGCMTTKEIVVAYDALVSALYELEEACDTRLEELGIDDQYDCDTDNFDEEQQLVFEIWEALDNMTAYTANPQYEAYLKEHTEG